MFSHNMKITHWIKKKTTYLGVAVLGVSTLLIACEVPTETEDPQVTTPGQTDVTETAPETVEERITVRRLVEDTIGEYGFVTEAAPGEPVVVINITGETFALPDEDIPIQATGDIRELSLPEIAAQYGLELEEDLYAEYENQPVILAESLAFAPTPEDLAEAPLDYFMDRQIAIEGDLRQLEEAPNAFAIFDDDWGDQWGVLVLADDQEGDGAGAPLEEGESIVVTGVVRQFSREVLDEAGFDFDEAQMAEFEERYQERPVIIADGVYDRDISRSPSL